MTKMKGVHCKRAHVTVACRMRNQTKSPPNLGNVNAINLKYIRKYKAISSIPNSNDT